MASLEKYFNLIEQYPRLFHNPEGEGIIRIIDNPDQIRAWQETRKEELASKGKPLEWADIGVLVDDPWFWVIRDLVEFPDGRRIGYIRFVNRKSLEGGVNVVIFPMQGDKVLLLKHFRHDTRQWYWEFPRGFGEPGLTVEENVRKELQEETGLLPTKLVELGRCLESDGETVYYFVELPNQRLVFEYGEGIAGCTLLSQSELKQWVKEGKLSDAFSIMAYMLNLSKPV